MSPHKNTLARKVSNFLLPALEKYYRVKYIGLENIPDTPFLGVGNHLGVYFIPESYLWLGKYHSLDNKPKMSVLVHKVFKELTDVLNLGDESFGMLDANPESALNALKSGNALTVYPGGDRENSKAFVDRNKIDFFEHLGYIKLALRARVPIVPIVGIGGGETLFVLSSGEQFARRTQLTKMFKLHSWPIYWSFPFGWHIGHFPHISLPLPSQITLSILPPIYLDEYHESAIDNPLEIEQINKMVVDIMQKEMDKLAEGRIPIIGKL